MKNTLLILDLDNTLTNSSLQHQAAFKRALSNFGITSINTQWSEYEHLTDSYIFKYNYSKVFNNIFKKELISELDSNIYDEIKKELNIKEVDGAKNFINWLNKENIPYCVATGSLLKPALYKINNVGLEINSNRIYTCNNCYSREDFILEAIRTNNKINGVNFQNIISIGDGVWDHKTARQLGINFAGIGEENKEYFLSNNVKYIFDNWLDFDFENLKNIFPEK